MSENNKSYRIRTEVGKDKSLYFKLDQKFDIIEILSLKLRQEGLYRLHTSDYGVIVGRVLANNGFGIPNAKISVFIQISDDDVRRNEILGLYSYNTTRDKDMDGIRYNLLPNTPVNECHKAVGTFPSKTMVLDNEIVLEVYDKYYKYTTKTNESGDYMIFGVPTGNQTVHVDLDLSDIGLLSQRPRDFVYKGYTIEQFENANQFKSSTELTGLSQIFSQDSMVEVIPFWGDDNEGLVGISRNDIDIQFKFEPTCVFMGSVVSDNSSNGFSKKCVPTNAMGNMDELVTGNGTIEMIRKKTDGSVEEFQIQGNQLINGNGVWCYQIPMNLDYMKTDEYGNMVPTDNPEEGIPTRTRVRFRISMQDFEQNTSNYFRGKFLVPHNPKNANELDYAFGSGTQDSSFKDLFLNNVYTVKSYIPRIQKARGVRSERFSGIKHCNIHGQNNPIPYNNIRIRLPFMFTIICAMIKAYIWVITMVNKVLGALPGFGAWSRKDRRCTAIGDSLCPDLEGWYFAPGCRTDAVTVWTWRGFSGFKLLDIDTWLPFTIEDVYMVKTTYDSIVDGVTDDDNQAYVRQDTKAIDYSNKYAESVCLTTNIDYLIQCIEINLAQEYKVIQFDFYNDWINGLIYIPRWMRFVRKKRSFLFGLIKIKSKIKGCMTDTSIFSKNRYLMEQCSISYGLNGSNGYTALSPSQKNGCADRKQKCHKKQGRKYVRIFGNNGGLVNETKTLQDQNVYYFRPCEWSNGTKVIFFATDLCLLGSLNDCDLYGIPQAFKSLSSSTYQMPTNLALTNLEEDGYLYSQNDTGTICSPNAGYNSNEKVTQSENSFSGANKHDSDYDYGFNDDAVPMTESAGIDWGYTGPGQGVAKFDNANIYQPGGHFLGISCSQSETNVKSCINLGRICEQGVGMSQRVLIPKTYDERTDTWNYTNVMPNGFISQDEIYDSDFRTMFATMNFNGLKTMRDEKTGYLKYDFMTTLPTNFDGTFRKYASKYKNNYESSESNKLKIDLNGKVAYTDDEISDFNNSVVRSLESTNLEYYRFRFGIDKINNEDDKKHFLIVNGNEVSMPVYENSFYFYFGLSDGATALDEFRKQFFSTCINNQEGVNTLSISSPTFKVENKDKDQYSISDFINNQIIAVVKINGGQMPYTIEMTNINDGKIDTEDEYFKKIIPIRLGHSKLGKYRIKVTDAEENSVTQDYDFTLNSIFSLNLQSHDYLVNKSRIGNDWGSNCDKYGGYISWDGIFTMLGKNFKSEDVQKDIEIVISPDMDEGNTSDGRIAFYPGKTKHKVSLKIKGRDFPYNEYTIDEVDSLDYWVGDEKFNFKERFEYKRPSTTDWYDELGDEEKWIYRHVFTRQNINDGLDVQYKITGKTPNSSVMMAGSPERQIKNPSNENEYMGEVLNAFKTISASNLYPERYTGYDLSLNDIYAPTEIGVKQNYQIILYDSKGQDGAGYEIELNGELLKVNESGIITCSKLSNLMTGYRYLVTNKNISLFGYAVGGHAGKNNSNGIYIDEDIDIEDIKEYIENVPSRVYEFHSFPVYYRPFYN